MMDKLPKRLIEVDLPIQRISAHARREKSIRHGHISTLHLWWARRPLAACRAVLCAALWPDPADPLCPPGFRQAAARIVADFARKVATDKELAAHCAANWRKWKSLAGQSFEPDNPVHMSALRFALLDFIADFADWDNSTQPDYLRTSRALTQAAHEALGGLPGTRPLVVDPFAGGGSIPLEALRIGADAFASDLNPVAVLLNKVVLEYIPKYGARLAEEVRRWGAWVKEQAEKELSRFYPPAEVDASAYFPRVEEIRKRDGMKWRLVRVVRETPIAYLWARTVTCEGPGCGAEVPLIRSLWLAKKSGRAVALRMLPNREAKRVDLEIIERSGAKVDLEGTVRRGSATCPCCGYSTPVKSVRRQLKARKGGTADARLLAVVSTIHTEREAERSRAKEVFEDQGRFYRLPVEADLGAAREAAEELERRQRGHSGALSLVPDEEISLNEIRRISVPIYGMTRWGDLFTPRQALALAVLAGVVRSLKNGQIHEAVQTCLGLAVSRQAIYGSAVCSWHASREIVRDTFGRQAVPMVWDFTEVATFSGSSGDFTGALEWVTRVCEENVLDNAGGDAQQVTATGLPLPDDSAHSVVTDPPYYDAVPYAHLSDFFYVWLRRSIGHLHPDLFRSPAVPKDEEIVVDRPHELSNSTHDVAYYERELTRAFAEARRVLRPDGIATIVFASKTTASWEAILQALLDAGWIITASWPIDTEMETRVAAQGQARLASSIHLVCRPREDAAGVVADSVGDWRDVLGELPERIHAWMPRLKQEGIVGADAIFACLGPALEIFSRYSRVEKASGEQVGLRDYLPHVWAAVAKEALSMVFEGADASGFEEDARLTAMWLWTLKTSPVASAEAAPGEETEEDEEAPEPGKKPKRRGLMLEYDAARKIAQGLGAHLEELKTVVVIHGDEAELLSVSDRSAHLFGKDEPVTIERRKKKDEQLGLPGMEEESESQDAAWALGIASQPGATVLDRLHQSMLLFGLGRTEALKRFLVDQGAGKAPQFWVLAQALAGLYPAGSQELRWVEGVLARKKGLGF